MEKREETVQEEEEEPWTEQRIAKANQAVFDSFAATYDEDVLTKQSYTAYKSIANALVNHLGDNKSARIFDAGSGTGLVGQELIKMGFCELVAGDISAKMLEELRKKNIYKDDKQIVLGESLPFEDKYFDAIASCGVFQPHGPPVHSFNELIRITKSGGIIAFTQVTYVSYRSRVTGKYEEMEFPAFLKDLEDKKKWTLIQSTEEDYYTPGISDKLADFQGQDPDTKYRIFVYRVL